MPKRAAGEQRLTSIFSVCFSHFSAFAPLSLTSAARGRFSQPAAPSPHSRCLPSPCPRLGRSRLRTSWAAQGAVCSAVQLSQTLPACVKCNLLSRTKRLQTRAEFWQASGLVAKGCSWLSDRKQDCFSPPLAPQMLPPLCVPGDIRLITLACLR